MSKIRDTLNVIQSGARNNKYRILFPMFGEEIDILCNTSSNPGREIGTVDVFLKGRKYTLAGDMADEGTWSITIYNTEDFLVRNFFLKVISEIQDFNTPFTINDNNRPSQAFSDFNYSGQGNNIGNQTYNSTTTNDFLNDIGLGKQSDSVNNLLSVFDEMRNNWNTINNAINSFNRNSDVGIGDGGAVYTPVNGYMLDGSYAARPWYMTDILVQQLDSNSDAVTVTRLHNAFATTVGPIEYTDEVGNISTTEITFKYSGIDYNTDTYYPVI